LLKITVQFATGWSAFQIVHTSHFRADFNRLTTEGACKGIKLLPTYWVDRGRAEIPSLALNIAALMISALLTWKLVKVYIYACHMTEY